MGDLYGSHVASTRLVYKNASILEATDNIPGKTPFVKLPKAVQASKLCYALGMQHSLSEADLASKTVLLRLDLDVPLASGRVTNNSRLEVSLPTLRYCLENQARVVILGHLGRPEGPDPAFSLVPVIDALKELLHQDIFLISNLERAGEEVKAHPVSALENLRFYPGEAAADPGFTSKLAALGDIFINEAFAVGHRPSASVVGLPALLPSYLGFQFEREVAAVSRVLDQPERPVLGILGGTKPDKLEFVDNFLAHVDKLLLGGRLGEYTSPYPKLEIASLTPDGFDIDASTVTCFSQLIAEAKTIIWNGPMGKYEDPAAASGTRQIAEAIANSSAYKLAGGGDTLAAISQFGLQSRFDHLSVGGGAMLYYLAKGSLPALDAIRHQQDR